MPALKKILAAALIVASTTMVSAVAAAVGPVISSATVDAGGSTLLINGFNFPADPRVYMGRSGRGMDRLQVLASGRTVIQAALLTSAPGTYLVAVLDQSMDTTELVSISVTIADSGAQGPPGPRGDRGPQGVQGDPGPQGPQGNTGTAGPQGDAGAQGLQGDPGADGLHCWDLNGNGTCDPATEDTSSDGQCTVLDCKGPQGDTGATGAQGNPGPQGSQGPQGDPGNLALAGEGCPNGQFLSGFDGAGAVICSSPVKHCTESYECAGIGVEYCFKNGCTGIGICEPVPGLCVALPVCGCDGVDYGDPCLAAAAGTNVASIGPCP